MTTTPQRPSAGLAYVIAAVLGARRAGADDWHTIALSDAELLVAEIARLRAPKCHICGQETDLCCSDCAIDLGAKIYVCAKTSCRNQHNTKCPAEIQKRHDAQMERVKACEHIAEGEEGWEKLRNECPSTAAVASLRDAYERLRAPAGGDLVERARAGDKRDGIEATCGNRLSMAEKQRRPLAMIKPNAMEREQFIRNLVDEIWHHRISLDTCCALIEELVAAAHDEEQNGDPG